MKIIIDERTCNGCGNCIASCPTKKCPIIIKRGKAMIIDSALHYCIELRKRDCNEECVLSCPSNALSIEE